MQCPSCSSDNPAGSRFCGACGQAIGVPSQMSTAPVAAVAGAGPAMVVGVGRLISSDSIPVGGLTPGAILLDRYRIIGLLGRGGMGEVYRADDLKLGQPVALKFLPKSLSDDPVRRERFFAEVRITRQLSHPNICRVYDIAEAQGQHFLSMEYIDGEDLASLVKRIGYLSNEKALDIARQLVAGLAAAHERGVLHRDLKPANIMLDGRGRVRITDFGLAIAATDDQSGDASGTPAYMAPEQLAGKGASVRSDIYALGLVPGLVGKAFMLLVTALYTVALTRYGVVAILVTAFVVSAFQRFPLTLQTSVWYAGIGYAALLVVGAIAVFGFRTSLGGRPLLGTARFEE
jgi:predicted Ser/Thr protein kinase